MKTKKAIFGLIFSVSMLIGLNSMQKTTQANIGWGISAAFGADNNTTSSNVIGGAAIGAGGVAAAIAGAEIGAKIGVWGGIAGIAAGAVIGGL